MVYLTDDLPVGDVASTAGSFSVGEVEGLTIGDWDGDGIDSVGFVDAGAVRLKNTNDSGPPDITYEWGQSGWAPVAGIWTEGG